MYIAKVERISKSNNSKNSVKKFIINNNGKELGVSNIDYTIKDPLGKSYCVYNSVMLCNSSDSKKNNNN